MLTVPLALVLHATWQKIRNSRTLTKLPRGGLYALSKHLRKRLDRELVIAAPQGTIRQEAWQKIRDGCALGGCKVGDPAEIEDSRAPAAAQ